MLTPSQFKKRWQTDVVDRDPVPDDVRLVTAPPDRTDADGLPDAARRFLVEAGLPKSCAPYIGFEEVGRGLPRLWEVFSPGQWGPERTKPLEPFRMIGSDGAGNPLCVDCRDGRVVLLDHEDAFRTKQFINSSVAQLAECLLAYYTAAEVDRRQAMGRVDAPAVETGAFWYHETAAADVDPARGDDRSKNPWWKFW